MKNFLIIFLLSFLFVSGNSLAQKKPAVTTVSFISAQFVYVKVPDGFRIAEGDTFSVKRKGILKPVLRAKFTSTRSAACEKLDTINPAVNDTMYAVLALLQDETISRKQETGEIKLEQGDASGAKKQTQIAADAARWNGRVSVNSFSGFNNYTSKQYIRWRYSLNVTGENIIVPGLHLSNYTIFSYSVAEWQQVKQNVGKALKIYDLSADYSIDSSMTLTAGRGFNYHLSGIGAFDGMSAEVKKQSFYYGGFIGSRPNFDDYGYNVKYFQFGAYGGRKDSLLKGEMENTLGVYNQTNDFKTDRRFLYFQHTSNPYNSLSLYFSGEADLYEKIKDVVKNTFSFTGMYAVLRWTPESAYSFSLSYDARKNVIYYETYKSELDSTIARDLRQGYRLSATVRPYKGIITSVNAGYRFEKSDAKPSLNLGGNIYFTSLYYAPGSLSAGYNYLSGSYVNSNDVSLTYNLPFNEMLDFSFSGRHAEWKYPAAAETFKQNSITADLSMMITRKFWVIFSLESVYVKKNTDTRLLVDFSTRF